MDSCILILERAFTIVNHQLCTSQEPAFDPPREHRVKVFKGILHFYCQLLFNLIWNTSFTSILLKLVVVLKLSLNPNIFPLPLLVGIERTLSIVNAKLTKNKMLMLM